MHKINEKGRKRSGFSFCPFKRTFSHMEEKWGFWLHIFSSHLTRQCASLLQIASMGAYTTLFLHSLIFFVIPISPPLIKPTFFCLLIYYISFWQKSLGKYNMILFWDCQGRKEAGVLTQLPKTYPIFIPDLKIS